MKTIPFTVKQMVVILAPVKTSLLIPGKNYRIYILVQSLKTIKFIILPFMHKTMTYKLGV